MDNESRYCTISTGQHDEYTVHAVVRIPEGRNFRADWLEFWNMTHPQATDLEPLPPLRESDLTPEELVWLRAGTFTMVQIERRRCYHGVLVVTLADSTERVLDNRYPYPMPLAQLKDIGYEPDIIQMAIWPRKIDDWESWRWA